MEAKNCGVRRRTGSAWPISYFLLGFLSAFVSHYQRPAAHSAFHAEFRAYASLCFDGLGGVGARLRVALLSSAHGRRSLLSPQSGGARACDSALGGAQRVRRDVDCRAAAAANAV